MPNILMGPRVMTDKTGLLEKEMDLAIPDGSAAFADPATARKAFSSGHGAETSEKPSVRTSHPTINQASTTNVKLPAMDGLLEDTLVSIKPAKHLTRREAEVLKLIVSGNTNKKIAQKLYRTERTVEYHRNRLMCKLGAHNAADLVKRAIAMGIV